MLSVIPIWHVNPSNQVIEETIMKRLETKKVKVCDIFIRRSNQGTFIWSDVRIEAFNGKELEATDFELANCRVLPFYGSRKQCSSPPLSHSRWKFCHKIFYLISSHSQATPFTM